MASGAILRTAARCVLLALLAAAPLALGRFQGWEGLALLLVAATVGALWLAGGQEVVWRPRIPDLLLFGAFGLCCVVTAWSVSRYDSLVALSLLAGGLLTFLLCRTLLADGAWNQWGWWAVVAGGTAAALWGLREYAAHAVVVGDPLWRVFGPFYNPNCLGGYMALALAVPLALALGTRRHAAALPLPAPSHQRPGKAPRPKPGRAFASPGGGAEHEACGRLAGRSTRPGAVQEPPPRYAQIGAASAAILMSVALLCTASKGAWLGAVTAVVVLAGLGVEAATPVRRKVRRGTALMVALAAVALLVFPPTRTRLALLVHGQGESSSFRVLTWRGTLGMIAARPLTGFGPGAFQHAFPRYAVAGFTRQAHQTPLQLAAESGVLAALALLVGIAAAMAQIARRARQVEASQRLLMAAALGGGAGFWVHNLVDYTFYVAALHAVFWGLLGLAWGSGPQDSPSPERALPGWTRRALVGLLAVLAVWAAVALYSSVQLAAAKSLVRSGALELASQRLPRVLPWDPGRWVEASRIAEAEALWAGPAKLQEALELRQRAIVLQPTEPVHWVSLSRMHYLMHDLAAAHEALAHALSLHPTSTRALAALGRVQDELGRKTEALATYRRLSALYDSPVGQARPVQFFPDENYAYAWVPLARDALGRGDKGNAMQYALKALEVLAQYLSYHRAYPGLFEHIGGDSPAELAQLDLLTDDALGVLRALREPLALVHGAVALAGGGDKAKAKSVLREVIGSLSSDARREDRAVAALAKLRLGELLGSGDPEGQQLRAEGVALAKQVWPLLSANSVPKPWGWRAQDADWMRAQVDEGPDGR